MRHFNCNSTDFELDCPLLRNFIMDVPRMGLGAGRGVTLTSPSRKLTLSLAVPLDSKVLAMLVPILDQQLTARPDHLAGSVEYLPIILESQ